MGHVDCESEWHPEWGDGVGGGQFLGVACRYLFDSCMLLFLIGERPLLQEKQAVKVQKPA
jgi:hypothetical protein